MTENVKKTTRTVSTVISSNSELSEDISKFVSKMLADCKEGTKQVGSLQTDDMLIKVEDKCVVINGDVKEIKLNGKKLKIK